MSLTPAPAAMRARRLVFALALLPGICGAACAPQTTAAKLSPCASILPGAAPARFPLYLGVGFPFPYVFPPGSQGTAPAVALSGPGLYRVYTFDVCSPGTTTADVQAFFEDQLPALDHGWYAAANFPDDGGLMSRCAVRCWFDINKFTQPVSPQWFMIFDAFVDRGHGVVTYGGRYAQPPVPACSAAQFIDSPYPNFSFSLPDFSPSLPLPPLTYLRPHDIPGVRRYDLCSPGTSASVMAFMTKELPATGWQQTTTDSRCVYVSDCWTNQGRAISWSVPPAGATDWQIAWHTAAG
jgi:hypothetical protein